MAKIDTSRIEGYAEMTAEDKLKALEAFEYEEADNSELERLKSAISKANSESADWKRKYQAQLSEDDKKKQEQADELETLKSQLAELQAEKVLSGYKASLLGLGFDEKLAGTGAKSLAEGKMDEFFADAKKFLDNYEQKIKAEVMKATPKPPAGTGEPEKMTKEKLKALPWLEQKKFSEEHPEEYRQIYKGD